MIPQERQSQVLIVLYTLVLHHQNKMLPQPLCPHEDRPTCYEYSLHSIPYEIYEVRRVTPEALEWLTDIPPHHMKVEENYPINLFLLSNCFMYFLYSETLEQDLLKPNYLCVNCTVTYYIQCMSWSKCKSSCMSMGAAGFRYASITFLICFNTECNGEQVFLINL